MLILAVKVLAVVIAALAALIGFLFWRGMLRFGYYPGTEEPKDTGPLG